MTLPTALTPAAILVAGWTAAASGDIVTGILPGSLVIAFVALDYALWRRRGEPWHDAPVILLLLPALACALWIGIGGLVLGSDPGVPGRLLLEVGPGLALTGLITTLLSYHGRHPPAERKSALEQRGERRRFTSLG